MGFMVAAYLVVWAGLFLYVFWLARKSRKLAEEVKALREAIVRRGHE